MQLNDESSDPSNTHTNPCPRRNMKMKRVVRVYFTHHFVDLVSSRELGGCFCGIVPCAGCWFCNLVLIVVDGWVGRRRGGGERASLLTVKRHRWSWARDSFSHERFFPNTAFFFRSTRTTPYAYIHKRISLLLPYYYNYETRRPGGSSSMYLY